ncbi:MAG TPA: pyruvate kinase [Opitutales bacterium]|nr:pyruvate kinase [Opitutales bacterium]
MRRTLQHTKITFTIGPATESEEMLEKLILTGVDLCRLNMAHGNHDWVRTVVRRIKTVCGRIGRHIAIMMDVKGPEIRTGDLATPILLEKGQILDFITEQGQPAGDGHACVSVNYPDLPRDVIVGNTVLVDSGLIRLEVLETHVGRVRCRVNVPSKLSSRRHLNLPGVKVNLPALTMKDRADIEVGIAEGIDFIALSFVREANDIDLLRRFLTERKSLARIIAKIEDQSAIENLEEIVSASDGLMVARGDLGIECPYEELPIIQRRAIQQCIIHRKPVIVATHMLESMISSPVPTRAEVSDIANAALEQTDCIMLSGETTTGKYPLECVQTMQRIVRRIEAAGELHPTPSPLLKTHKDKLLGAAARLAQEDHHSGILVFTRNGNLPAVLSALRPRHCPIYAFTDVEHVFKQLLLHWGVEPFLMEFSKDYEQTILDAFEYLKRREWVQVRDWLVVVTNVIMGEKLIDTIQLREVE